MTTYILIAYTLGVTIFWLKELIRRKNQRKEYIAELTSLRNEMQADNATLRGQDVTVRKLMTEIRRLTDGPCKRTGEIDKLKEKEELCLGRINQLSELLEQKNERILELERDNAEQETLITMKDAELNARDDERDMHWEEMKRYLLAAQASKEKNSKLIVISNCCECNDKECAIRMPTGNIPTECPLKDAHALYSLQITVKGFSTAAVMNKSSVVSGQASVAGAGGEDADGCSENGGSGDRPYSDGSGCARTEGEIGGVA